MRRGDIEKEIIASGKRPIGVDEVGRGCIAGPVYAACASLDYAKLFALPRKQKNLIRDSKTLTSEQRDGVLEFLGGVTKEVFIGFSDVDEIEQHGIVGATFLAMRRALNQCRETYDILLVDGKQLVKGYAGEQIAIIEGDHWCFSIAAASIVAKQARDQFMRAQAEAFPAYGFETHVGYGTKKHLRALKENGICPLHRKTFAPVTARLALPIKIF